MKVLPPWQFTAVLTAMLMGTMIALIVVLKTSVALGRPHLAVLAMIPWGWVLCRAWDRWAVPFARREAKQDVEPCWGEKPDCSGEVEPELHGHHGWCEVHCPSCNPVAVRQTGGGVE